MLPGSEYADRRTRTVLERSAATGSRIGAASYCCVHVIITQRICCFYSSKQYDIIRSLYGAVSGRTYATCVLGHSLGGGIV